MENLMSNFDNQEDDLWNALAPSAEDLKPKKEVAPKKGAIRRRLEHVASLPEKATELTPFQKEHSKVVEWLTNYKGTFDFYLSVKSQYEQRGYLSDKQCDAIYRAIARDQGARPVTTPVTQPKQNFSISKGEVIRVGKFFAKEIGEKSGLTRAHFVMEVVDVLRETEKAYLLKLRMSSQRTSHCCVCGLALTNPESVAKGIGPICGEEYELSWESDKDALIQLSEKLQTLSSVVETWLPKSAIKERIQK
jgi:hypothetical protein